MQPVILGIALLVVFGLVFRPLIDWAEREDEKRAHCPDCGAHLLVAEVKPVSDGLFFLLKCPQCPHEDAEFLPNSFGVGAF